MDTEIYDVRSLAKFLSRDPRDVEKLADKGRIPARRVAGAWTFHRSEVHHWLEKTLPEFTDRQLADMEQTLPCDAVAAGLLRPGAIDLALDGRTVPGVLDSLVALANHDWMVYEPNRVLAAVRAREAKGSTALPGGVAIPHPDRRLPECLGDDLVAFGRASSGLHFGGEGTTDLYFLILCRTQATHLRMIARLNRLFLAPGFLDRLRSAERVDAVVAAVAAAEAACN